MSYPTTFNLILSGLGFNAAGQLSWNCNPNDSFTWNGTWWRGVWDSSQSTYSFTNYSGSVNAMSEYRPLAYPHPLRYLFDTNGASAAAITLNAAVANVGSIVYTGP